MREKKSSGKTPAHKLSLISSKNEIASIRFGLSLYSAQLRKNTKIPSIPIIHEGENWKKSQKGSQTGVKRAKKSHKVQNFAPCKNFTAYQNFRYFIFLASSALLSF